MSVGRTRRVRSALAGLLLLGTAAGCGSGGGGGAMVGAQDAQPLTPAPICDDVRHPDVSGALPDRPDPSVRGTVRLWGWYNVAPEATLSLLAKYYPNVHVRFDDYSLDDMPVKLQTALNAGTGAPDLAMVEDKRLPTVWNRGLYDLTDCLDPYRSDFPQYKWARIQRPDGVLTGVPWDINPGYVTYRRDVLRKYHIDPSTIRTWSDFVAAGRKVVSRSHGAVKWTLSNTVETGNGTETLLNDIEILTNQAGGRMFDRHGRARFDNPTSVKVLELLKSLRDKGLTLSDAPSQRAELTALRDGKVATFIGEASSRFFLSSALADTKGKWGIMPLPAWTPGGTRGAINGGTSIVLPDQGHHTAAAWAFLKIWLLTVDGRYRSFQHGQLVENLFVPAKHDPRFTAPDPFYGGQSFLGSTLSAAASAPPFPSSPALPVLENSIQSQLPGYLSGAISARELARSAQASAAG